jgi:hypothetical protein
MKEAVKQKLKNIAVTSCLDDNPANEIQNILKAIGTLWVHGVAVMIRSFT